jgi:hypothetical protein
MSKSELARKAFLGVGESLEFFVDFYGIDQIQASWVAFMRRATSK